MCPYCGHPDTVDGQCVVCSVSSSARDPWPAPVIPTDVDLERKLELHDENAAYMARVWQMAPFVGVVMGLGTATNFLRTFDGPWWMSTGIIMGFVAVFSAMYRVLAKTYRIVSRMSRQEVIIEHEQEVALREEQRREWNKECRAQQQRHNELMRRPVAKSTIGVACIDFSSKGVTDVRAVTIRPDTFLVVRPGPSSPREYVEMIRVACDDAGVTPLAIVALGDGDLSTADRDKLIEIANKGGPHGC